MAGVIEGEWNPAMILCLVMDGLAYPPAVRPMSCFRYSHRSLEA